MKVDSFRVVPALPEKLQGLREIAYNLLWTWDDELRAIFSRLDRNLWDSTYQNPVLHARPDRARSASSLARDESFLAFYERVLERSTPTCASPPGGTGATRSGRSSPTSRPSSASPSACRSTPAAWACWPATT